jgi:mono/diheme cytochrome c family protein
MRTSRALVLSLATLLCSLATTSLAEVGAATEQERGGEEIFADKCVYCHAPGGWGTRVLEARVPEGEAPLMDRRNLPAHYTAFVVRNGIGSMPQLTPTDLSDAELARLAQWLDERN